MSNNLTKLDVVHGSIPMEKTLCVFRSNSDNSFVIGYITWIDKKFMIKQWGKSEYHNPLDFSEYQSILTEKGGFLFA